MLSSRCIQPPCRNIEVSSVSGAGTMPGSSLAAPIPRLCVSRAGTSPKLSTIQLANAGPPIVATTCTATHSASSSRVTTASGGVNGFIGWVSTRRPPSPQMNCSDWIW